MSKIVRASKYRHVFGTVAKKENCYDDIKVTRSAWDGNFIAANPNFFGVVWDASGGGAFAVIPFSQTGKISAAYPLVNGHSQPVLDIAFNPMNDNVVVSVSEDCTGKVWVIPDGGFTELQSASHAAQTLSGHKRKVGQCTFHPSASNILATSGADLAVKIWDIEAGKDIISIDDKHTEVIFSTEWNHNGSLLASTAKDKKLRILDPRHHSVAGEASETHAGVKTFRASWLGRKEKLFTVGFTKTSEREYCVWDPKNLSAPLTRANIDSASGVIMPFYDADTNVMFLVGKGDGNIRYYEVVDEPPFIYYLTEFKSATPQRGACVVPKRALDIGSCEIVRILKLGAKNVEPIAFQVPRKSDVFQEDIFPDCFSGEPTLSASDWAAGKNGDPKTTSLANGFVKKVTTSTFTPTAVEAPKAMSEGEMRAEIEKLTKRVAFLESQIVTKDARIKELEHK